ncbi:hypothetical protein UlMin_036197 [Ulmus minor]
MDGVHMHGYRKSLHLHGKPSSLESAEAQHHLHGLCLEKIGNGSYLNMAAHPDGSNRAFFSAQSGLEGTLGFDEFTPCLDLKSKVYYDGNSFGMMGMAFHPKFAHNGSFYASFYCDKVKSPDYSGRCSCNTDANCDPFQLSSSYTDFIRLYAKLVEARRIFTIRLTFPFNHGSQILFGPTDGYLYAMVGDGGQGGDPFGTKEIGELGLWGNYFIPQDNPYSEDKKLLPEIWVLGLRNPWCCSFDSKRPLYFRNIHTYTPTLSPPSISCDIFVSRYYNHIAPKQIGSIHARSLKNIARVGFFFIEITLCQRYANLVFGTGTSRPTQSIDFHSRLCGKESDNFIGPFNFFLIIVLYFS